jgi:LPXTG-motif cell wall-anchored protein
VRINWKGSIIPVLLIALGVLWILQGTDSLGQSGGMNGDSNWTVIGALAIVAGIGLLVFTNRRFNKR